MSFIVQPVEAPSIFTIANRVNSGAGGLVNFYLNYVDTLIYLNDASANTVLNIAAATGETLNAVMDINDVAKIQFQIKNGATNYKLDYIQIDSGLSTVDLSLPGTLTSWTGYASGITSYELEILKTNDFEFSVEAQIVQLRNQANSEDIVVSNASATLLSAGISVSFDTTGSSTLDTSYTLISNPSGTSLTQTSSGPFVITSNLGTGTYTYQVAPLNAAGLGEFSTASNAVTLEVPGAPSGLSASAIATADVEVNFSPGFSGWAGAAVSYSGISSPFTVNGTASGSTMTFSGLSLGYTYTFTVRGTNAAGAGAFSSASNTVSLPFSIQTLVVGGGGAGGSSDNIGSGPAAGGGGAGGYRTATVNGVRQTNYSIIVGAAGNSSTFDTITAAGGGQGGDAPNAGPAGAGGNGGSGGGAGFVSSVSGAVGVGNTPVVSPSQGNNGYTGGTSNGKNGGGGGGSGATQNLGPASRDVGGGTASSITGSSLSYAAGGGGGRGDTVGAITGNPGGSSIGGTGAVYRPILAQIIAATAGTINTGSGGGGGAGRDDGGAVKCQNGAQGGSGVVIVRYPASLGTISGATGLTYSSATVSTDIVLTFTAGAGNISWS